jgi:ubiquinone biosynthesis protein
MIRFYRLVRILRTVVRYRLDTLLDDVEINPAHLPLGARIAWALRPSRLLPSPRRPAGERLRLALETLGPVFIKFGQILSTRKDLLPPHFADHLARLQDQVPPFPSEAARALIEAALAAPIEQVFASFENDVLASASVAQVHAATLRDGSDVVVKVIRPDIEPVIGEDIELMTMIARLLERASADARRLRLVTLVEDYRRTIFGELDLTLEGANTAQLRRNFAESPLLYVPRVYWRYTRRNVLVLERIRGVPIANIDTLLARGTDMRLLAERGVETFFTQVFEHNFFHADMHPGNIFVDVDDPLDPHYVAVDCAIIGSLTEADQNYLAQNLLAFFHQDYARVAQLHLESGWIPPNTDVREFEAVIRALCEPIFHRPLKEIMFGHFLVSLFRAARQFDMEIQPQLVLLQKTLINIEGLGRQLYPDLDLWQTAKPFMERWMQRRMGFAATLRRLVEQGPTLLEQLPRLPDMVLNAFRSVERLEHLVAAQVDLNRSLSEEISRLTERQRARPRALQQMTGIALIVMSGVLFYLGVQTGTAEAANIVWAQFGTGTVSAVLGFLLMFGR